MFVCTVSFHVISQNTTFGDRCFATVGPHVWNNLPSHLHVVQSADTFRRHLKTYLFIMTLLGALFVLLHLRRRNLDFLDNWTHRMWYTSWLWGTLSTSIKEVMFSAFVCLLVWLCKNYSTDFHNIWWKWPRKKPLNYVGNEDHFALRLGLWLWLGWGTSWLCAGGKVVLALSLVVTVL